MKQGIEVSIPVLSVDGHYPHERERVTITADIDDDGRVVLTLPRSCASIAVNIEDLRKVLAVMGAKP